jgi:tetratricopeptide (TPR) repeat protein
MGDWEGAYNNFRVARMLMPFSVGQARIEGRIWVRQNPHLALEAWRDILEKGDPQRRVSYFGEVFNLMKPLGADGLRYLRRIARRQTDIYLKYLKWLSAKDFAEEIKGELESPEWIISLTDQQREELFVHWAMFGNLEDMEGLFTRYPEWTQIHKVPYGWMLYKTKRYEEAYRFLEAGIEKPKLPQITLPVNREKVRKAYDQQPDHVPVIYQYILLLKEEGNYRELIRTIERARKVKNSPAYFIYLHGIYSAKIGDWEKASKELLDYYLAASRAKR